MKSKYYIFGFLIALLVAVGIISYPNSSARCKAFDAGKDTFMSACQVTTHGHYDHAAYLFDLEDGLSDNVRHANLLFLGDSRVQDAFSTSALTTFTVDHPEVRPYLLGFGHVEQDVFSFIVLNKIKPKPSLVVINADPFFAGQISDHAKNLVENEKFETFNAQLKKFWHPVSEAACIDPLPIIGSVLCGSYQTVYRSIKDGRWIYQTIFPPKATVSEQPWTPIDNAAIRSYALNADRFLKQFNIDRRCVVLTHIPTVNGKPFIAQGIATVLGLTYIAPQLDGLFTYDNSHLQKASSERWSKAFLKELEPVLARCM